MNYVIEIDTLDTAQMLLKVLDAYARHQRTPSEVLDYFSYDEKARVKLEVLRKQPMAVRAALYSRIVKKIKTVMELECLAGTE